MQTCANENAKCISILACDCQISSPLGEFILTNASTAHQNTLAFKPPENICVKGNLYYFTDKMSY